VLELPDGSYVYGPDLNRIGLANDGYMRMLREETEKPIVVERAHRNFLKECVYMLYMHNRLQEANYWMAVLKEKYPEAVPKEETVEAYALKRFTSTITDIDMRRTTILLEGLLTQNFLNLAIDEDDRAAGFLRMARQIYDYYQEATKRRVGIVSLRPFEDMYRDKRNDFLDPASGVSDYYRARLRTKLGLPAEAPAPASATPSAAGTNPPPAKPGR